MFKGYGSDVPFVPPPGDEWGLHSSDVWWKMNQHLPCNWPNNARGLTCSRPFGFVVFCCDCKRMRSFSSFCSWGIERLVRVMLWALQLPESCAVIPISCLCKRSVTSA